MKFSISVAMLPADELLPIARAAEELGFHAAVAPESVFYPELVDTKYPYTKDGGRFWAPETPYVDPWVSIPAMAAVTTRLFFYTSVIKLAIKSPLLVAKTVGSAAVMSQNRVGLGVGLGWIPEEFAWCQTDYETRGPRANEAIEIIQACLAGGWVEYHGRHYDFGRLMMAPWPSAPVPLYVGGHSEPALRRAAKYGDGWTSAMLKTKQIPALVARLLELRREYGRAERPFEIQVAATDAFDLDGYKRLAEAGVTDFITQPWLLHGASFTSPAAEKIDGLRRFADANLGRL